MTERDKLNMRLAAILTTVRDSGNWSPLSPITMAMETHGLSLDGTMVILRLLQEAKLVTLTTEVVRLTDAGITMADKINAVVTK